MINNEFLKDISARISAVVPVAASVREDVEKGIHDVLQRAFASMNLVTREEFDAQLRVLERAEQTISTLEAKISALEQAHGLSHGDGPAQENDTP